MPRRPVGRVLYLIAAAALLVANVWVIVPSLLLTRLWEDEAFNLTVPLNLLAGLGYTSDGTLSGSTLTPFDPRISTGPVVLLPIAAVVGLGADPVIGGRSVMLLGWAALVAGLWVLGRSVGGPWAGLLAAAVPLALDTYQLPSPIQGPADILGEIPSAALIVWAAVAARRRPWLGGLLAGLAVQAKFIALLALPALAVLVFFAVPRQSFAARLRRLLPAAATALATAVAYELWKLLALGPAGYVESTRSFASFLLSGGQFGYRTPPGDKLALLLESWFVPAWAAVVVGLVALAGAVVAIVLVRRAAPAVDELVREDALWTPREIALVAITAFVGLATVLAWWSVSSHTPAWIRHPAPALMSFAPMVVAVSWLGWRALARREGAQPAGRGIRIGAAVACGVLVAGVAVSAARHAGDVGSLELQLADQRALAAEIAEVPEVAASDWLALQWGAAVPVGFLAGKHIGLVDAGPAVSSYPWIWAGELPRPCDEVARLPQLVVCAPVGE